MLVRTKQSRSFLRTIAALLCPLAAAKPAVLAAAASSVSQASDVAPIQLGIVLSFLSILLALAGLAFHRPRFVFLGSTIAVILSGFSLLVYLAIYSQNPDPMLPVATFCFAVLAASFTLAQTRLAQYRSTVLGSAGMLVATISMLTGLNLLSIQGQGLDWSNLHRVAFQTAAVFLALAFVVIFSAWTMSQPAIREPHWLPIGSSLFIVAFRLGLWHAYW